MSREIWVIDDDQSIRWVLEKALSKAGFKVCPFAEVSEPERLLRHTRPDVLLTDICMPGTDGLMLLRQIRQRHPELPVIVMTAHSDLDSAVAALHGGAFEYLPKPFDLDEMVQVVRRACQEHGSGETSPPETDTPEIIGAAPAMQAVFRAIGRLARSPVTVLITGESGTGKELVARALHRHSPRAGGPFIALNMAAIPKDLLESELFGHEKGAFTGADQRRSGRFEQAHGGTLFLDEIGDMPADLQTRLLRVLAEGEFYPLGAHTPCKVDVRIIAATHQNLETLVAEGRFREDLYHRLNVIRIPLPPLRQRREDIPALLHHFLKRAAAELQTEAKTLRPDVEAFLSRLDWPGNVRQLENLCRWLTVMAPGNVVHMEDLPPELRRPTLETAPATDHWTEALACWTEQALAEGRPNIAKEAITEAERILIRTALNHTRGHRQDAARLLGYGRNTLTRKINELGLDR
ncbi:two-component system, NtrC family, nitrogen regulation response regulator GlnG [Methylomarinovum caldicuralii]|uniref:DNA-binding transcriptional regulator NtrC n=1 Tax=Methylomarinovum caldicuralii TaxID=438856 RepID=A0AAU9CMP7_9GAMM|nr:nitrogen regulation protein NR(I) [Methylomarinovum caldicuralii]BCX80742.1 two-component system, NtrC family, nitrogen regulation response regulator GlnG [Methylomarinovum caldicuralii]